MTPLANQELPVRSIRRDPEIQALFPAYPAAELARRSIRKDPEIRSLVVEETAVFPAKTEVKA